MEESFHGENDKKIPKVGGWAKPWLNV